jgi:hypothetical protein
MNKAIKAREDYTLASASVRAASIDRGDFTMHHLQILQE